LDQRGAWRLLAALAALNVLGYVDRQLVAALAPLLMADLGLSRAEIGLLLGVAFIVVFSVATIAMGLLADRLSRPRLIAAGLGVWSAATALTGAAAGLVPLAAARALVGVGEATLSPSALAMLADTFPAARLGLANGVFYAGIPLGFACSFALAAWLAPWLGWRACFLVLGVADLAAVALVWRMADPPRRIPGATGDAPEAKGGLVSRLRRALADEPALVLVVLGAAALAYASASSQHGITWLVQERGFAYARAAWLSALVTATAGLAGNLAIGALTDRARLSGPASRLRALVSVGCFSLVVSAAFYLLPPTSPLFYACWLVTQAWMLGWYGPAFAAVQELAGPESRATVIGFALLTVNLLGVATGPWITGLIGDRASLTRGLVASLGVGAFGLLLLAVASARLDRARPGGSISP
jgi:MFS family permease